MNDTIQVLDVVYRVEYFDNITDVDPAHKERLFGYIDREDRTIRIYNGTEEDIKQTTWHELIHALADKLEIEELETEDAEKTIDLLATGIRMILKDNKGATWI